MPRKVGHADSNRLLTDAEELVIVNYIKQSYKRAMPVTKRNVLGALEDILLKAQWMIDIS